MFKKFCCKFCILLGAIWRYNPQYNPQHQCSKMRGGVKGRLKKKTDDLVRDCVPKVNQQYHNFGRPSDNQSSQISQLFVQAGSHLLVLKMIKSHKNWSVLYIFSAWSFPNLHQTFLGRSEKKLKSHKNCFFVQAGVCYTYTTPFQAGLKKAKKPHKFVQAGVCHTYNPPAPSLADLGSRLSGKTFQISQKCNKSFQKSNTL